MPCSTLSGGHDKEHTLKPKLEVADIFRRYGERYERHHAVSYEQKKAMHAILQCRTKALGGHIEQCDACGATEITYNSCRNRHCPKCQTVKKLRWVKQRESELLPVPYFHVVFTLPHELNPLVCSNPALLYDLLFKATAETLLAFGHDSKRLGGELGATLVLHTGGQNLSLHPHLHCIVPGGALTTDLHWIKAKSNYLFPVKAMAKHFRAHYLTLLQACYAENAFQFQGTSKLYAAPSEFNKLKDTLWKKNWVVYAKKPFAGPQQIIHYLSQYTHRIALSNHRLISCNNDNVSFRWRDYADENKTKIMTLTAEEFIRRYLQHVLPPRFTRLRHIGFLANRYKAPKLEQCRAALVCEATPVVEETTDELLLRVYKVNIHLCTYCHRGNKKTILTLLSNYQQHRGYDTS